MTPQVELKAMDTSELSSQSDDEFGLVDQKYSSVYRHMDSVRFEIYMNYDNFSSNIPYPNFSTNVKIQLKVK